MGEYEMTSKEAEKMIKEDGWYYSYANGSHHYYYHKLKKGKVTIPFHAGKDLDIRVVDSIKKQAGLK
jgi:predicted RNA binding protein YcfA (HicA-like mRNA interferase family)